MIPSATGAAGRAFCAAACVLALLCPIAAHSQDVSIDTPRLTVNPDGSWGYNSGASMSGTELGKMIENAIGKGNYQLTTVLLNTCHSGAGTKTVGAGLSGSHNVISTCGPGQTTTVVRHADGSLTGFGPAFFDSVIADPNKKVDDHFDAGKAGEPRLPKTPEEEKAAKEKFEAYRQRVIDENKKRTDAGKPPLAVPPEWDKGGRDKRVQEPESGQSADKPGDKKLAAGTKSNHAVIYRTDDREAAKKEAEKAKEAFKKAGFDSVSELTPPTAADNAAISKAEGGPAPKLRGDLATPDNLKNKLDELKAVMNPDEHLAVMVVAHGALTTASNGTQNQSGAENGARHSFANPMDHLGTHATASLLAEEAFANGSMIADDTLYARWAQPALVIQTLEEFTPSGRAVQVAINGQSIGSMILEPDRQGHIGFHYLPLSDEMIAGIVNTTSIQSGFDLTFDFGSPEDFFILATAEDLADMGGGLGHAGIGMLFNLSGSADAAVPEPGSLALLLLAGLAAAGAKRLRRQS